MHGSHSGCWACVLTVPGLFWRGDTAVVRDSAGGVEIRRSGDEGQVVLRLSTRPLDATAADLWPGPEDGSSCVVIVRLLPPPLKEAG